MTVGRQSLLSLCSLLEKTLVAHRLLDMSSTVSFHQKTMKRRSRGGTPAAPWSSLAALACAESSSTKHNVCHHNTCHSIQMQSKCMQDQCLWKLHVFSILVLPSLQLATNVPLPPSHIQQPVPRLLNNIREHCRVCNLPYEPNRGLTSSNQHTQWCHHFCPHLGTSCGALLVLLAIRSRSCCLVFAAGRIRGTGENVHFLILTC